MNTRPTGPNKAPIGMTQRGPLSPTPSASGQIACTNAVDLTRSALVIQTRTSVYTVRNGASRVGAVGGRRCRAKLLLSEACPRPMRPAVPRRFLAFKATQAAVKTKLDNAEAGYSLCRRPMYGVQSTMGKSWWNHRNSRVRFG